MLLRCLIRRRNRLSALPGLADAYRLSALFDLTDATVSSLWISPEERPDATAVSPPLQARRFH